MAPPPLLLLIGCCWCYKVVRWMQSTALLLLSRRFADALKKCCRNDASDGWGDGQRAENNAACLSAAWCSLICCLGNREALPALLVCLFLNRRRPRLLSPDLFVRYILANDFLDQCKLNSPLLVYFTNGKQVVVGAFGLVSYLALYISKTSLESHVKHIFR